MLDKFTHNTNLMVDAQMGGARLEPTVSGWEAFKGGFQQGENLLSAVGESLAGGIHGLLGDDHVSPAEAKVMYGVTTDENLTPEQAKYYGSLQARRKQAMMMMEDVKTLNGESNWYGTAGMIAKGFADPLGIALGIGMETGVIKATNIFLQAAKVTKNLNKMQKTYNAMKTYAVAGAAEGVLQEAVSWANYKNRKGEEYELEDFIMGVGISTLANSLLGGLGTYFRNAPDGVKLKTFNELDGNVSLAIKTDAMESINVGVVKYHQPRGNIKPRKIYPFYRPGGSKGKVYFVGDGEAPSGQGDLASFDMGFGTQHNSGTSHLHVANNVIKSGEHSKGSTIFEINMKNAKVFDLETPSPELVKVIKSMAKKYNIDLPDGDITIRDAMQYLETVPGGKKVNDEIIDGLRNNGYQALGFEGGRLSGETRADTSRAGNGVQIIDDSLLSRAKQIRPDKNHPTYVSLDTQKRMLKYREDIIKSNKVQNEEPPVDIIREEPDIPTEYRKHTDKNVTKSEDKIADGEKQIEEVELFLKNKDGKEPGLQVLKEYHTQTREMLEHLRQTEKAEQTAVDALNCMSGLVPITIDPTKVVKL
jgi:hypothetical protein